jgi:hypothetical protein
VSSSWWTGAAALAIAATCGCSSSRVDVSPGAPDGDIGDGSTTPPVADAWPGPEDSSSPPSVPLSPEIPCEEGEYTGAIGGSYASPLAASRLVVTGTVSLSLVSAGPSSQTCTVQGELERCSDVFLIRDGAITGVANDSDVTDDAHVGGYPYSCTMSGALLCRERNVVNGWIQCTVCPGPPPDAGTACSVFAGPLVATYDYPTLSFTGTWNGADALASDDGGSSAPDAEAISEYLSLDGGYGDGHYGGSGTWTAAPR